MDKQKEKFGFTTTVAMIVGIVVGSGIFFKTPQILAKVNGNILMGVIVFLVAALGIVFGGLTVSLYAKNKSTVGGIVTYSEMAWGKSLGYLAGWFQMVFYFPAIIAIIAWVGANYTCALFNLPNLLVSKTFSKEVWMITLLYLLGVYLLNCFYTLLAGKFQNFAMVIKLLALAILSIGGFMFGDSSLVIQSSQVYHTSSSGFLSALVIVVFAFDGWLVAPSIAHEIKNPKRLLPLALTIGPLIITSIYVAYFVGVSVLASPEKILQGVDPLQLVALQLFGPNGMKIVLILVVISILGTLNGLVLGYIRLPYALALRKEIVRSDIFSKINKKYDIPIHSVGLTLGLVLIWTFLHFLSVDGVNYGFTLLKGLEVDNLPIVLTYIFNSLLYIAVIFKGVEQQKLSVKERFVYPTLALFGALMVIYGGIIQPQFNTYFFIGIIGILAGWLFKPKNKQL